MSANSAFTDIVTTSLQGYSKTMADNISNSNALLRHIEEAGNRKPATGRSIVTELEYAENSSAQYYSGYETLNTSASSTFSAAEYAYKQLAGNVVISGLEMIENSGNEAVFNLLKSRIKNLEKTLKNTVATGLYADGTGSDGKEIGGLQLIVAGTPTNTVGGISGSSNTFWRNQVYDFSGEGVTASATTIQNSMNQVWLQTIRGNDVPKVITAGQTYFGFYWSSLQANQRFTSESTGAAGFHNLMFMQAPVIYDSACNTTRMYFLNTDYLHLRYSPSRYFTPLGEKSSINQDAIVQPIVFSGNLTCSNRSLQGVIQA